MKIMTNRQLKEMEERIRYEVTEEAYRRQKIDDIERNFYQSITDLSRRIDRLEEMANLTNVACKVDSTTPIEG